MPERYDIRNLGLPEQSEIHRLLREQPDIQPCSYRDGEYLVREGEESQDVFLILKGAFVVEQAPATLALRPAVLASVMCDLDHFAIVGEMSLLGVHRRSASVRSTGMSHTLRLSHQHMEAVLEGFPWLTRLLCQQFSTRLSDTNKRLKDFQGKFYMNAQQRMVNPGDVLFSAGDPATTLYQLMTGSVRLDRDGASESLGTDQLPMGFLEPSPYLRGGAHTATATAETNCFLIAIGATYRPAVVRSYPEVVLQVLEG